MNNNPKNYDENAEMRNDLQGRALAFTNRLNPLIEKAGSGVVDPRVTAAAKNAAKMSDGKPDAGGKTVSRGQ